MVHFVFGALCPIAGYDWCVSLVYLVDAAFRSFLTQQS